MTPEQIKSLAVSAGLGFVYRIRHYLGDPAKEVGQDQLVNFAMLIEAATREECAKQVEQDLYPDDAGKPYTQHYNSCIKRLAEIIRSGT